MLSHLFRRLKTALVIALIAGVDGAWAIENTLVLYPSITPSIHDGRLEISLEQLARIIAPRDIRESLGEAVIDLGAITESSQFSKAQLIARVAQIDELQTFDVVGPMVVRVNIPNESASDMGDALVAGAERYLMAHAEQQWPDAFRNIALQLVSDRNQLDMHGITRWYFDASHLGAFRRRTQVWVLANRDGKETRIPLWFKVTGEAKVWRAIDDIDAKTPAQPHRFVESWAEISRVDPIDVAPPSAALRLTTPIKRGDVLQKNYLEPIPAVQFGDQVRVLSAVGSVRVMTLAKVTRTADVGDRIMLESLSSEEQFEVLVVGPDQVELAGTDSHQ